ncbi:hypothetical protein D1Y84_04235 [Acidipila sp. EB88]|nr:hypothetical protein D1Y84_04235 [Acidipila sp. EB88]
MVHLSEVAKNSISGTLQIVQRLVAEQQAMQVGIEVPGIDSKLQGYEPVSCLNRSKNLSGTSLEFTNLRA